MSINKADNYKKLHAQYTASTNALLTKLRWLSLVRILLFLLFIFLGYKSVQTGSPFFIIGTFTCFILFILLIRFYDRIQLDVSFYKALAKLNQDEADFLSGKPSVYADGKEYIDPHHPYSYDLDLFGAGGLFSYLNRCSTQFGKEALSRSLLHPDTKQITARQDAIAELKEKLDFRQSLQAHGSLLDTREKEMRQLKAWLVTPASSGNKVWQFIAYLLPAISTGTLIYYFVTEEARALNLFYQLFVLNLVVAVAFSRKIMVQLSVSTSVTKILQQFAGQLKQIENEQFQSPLLKELQQRLSTGNETASGSISKLAALFNYLESVVNLVVSTVLNGLFIFHVHILFRLEKWKTVQGNKVIPWLDLLGEVEALNSFANLAYNNPDFCRPLVSDKETLVAKEMGHILIRPEKRISNSISFAENKFVILTGSNMSGKSTFLRTLGLNLVLARAGSNTCAKEFIFYPYSVHVSMRISDSLQDNESFFYAELKRLQAIIHELESGEKTFVILDEILRGTNSNDKHQGTVGLIHKLVNAGACGIIATHDLTVSDLHQTYPAYISNKCFESQIVGDELLFDYRLKDGVCTRLSASFLMAKMGIIS